ncbi:hypothetical protein KI387_036546, partial [Taxus chinensis]
MCTEDVQSIDIGASHFLEAQIATMAKQMGKLFVNSVDEVQSGLWCINFEVEGHEKDSFSWNLVHAMSVDFEIFHGDNN